VELLNLAQQPSGVAWPTSEWLDGTAPGFVDTDRLEELTAGVVEQQPRELGETLALLVVHHGRIVAEAYGPGTTCESTLISWSMAKSMVHAALGMAVVDGVLDTSAPISGHPAWADDDRRALSTDHLLSMRSGLEWVEDYLDDGVSDVIEMLFGSGQRDMAAFAAAKHLVAEPDTTFLYSSGTSNILSALLSGVVGGGSAGVAEFLSSRLFGPLGMTSAEPKFDDVGTWVASSYVYATARDFARFGLLYARDGVWDGQRLLPEGWVDRARRTQSIDPSGLEGYGEQWWTLRDDLGTFCASGYEGQRIMVVPANDLVVVRLGKTPAHLGDAWKAHLEELIGLFTPPSRTL